MPLAFSMLAVHRMNDSWLECSTPVVWGLSRVECRRARPWVKLNKPRKIPESQIHLHELFAVFCSIRKVFWLLSSGTAWSLVFTGGREDEFHLCNLWVRSNDRLKSIGYIGRWIRNIPERAFMSIAIRIFMVQKGGKQFILPLGIYLVCLHSEGWARDSGMVPCVVICTRYL